MLLEFEVENFTSFHEPVIFSMTPSPKQRRLKHHVAKGPSKGAAHLRFSALYGANGAGKSNLISAISTARQMIWRGTTANDALPYRPFKLNKESRKKPTSFRIDFQGKSGKQYRYSFSYDNTRILSEELSLLDQNGEARHSMFTRVPGADSPGIKVSNIAEPDQEFVRFVAKGTRKNQLFLTEANDRNVEFAKEVSEWFSATLQIISPNARPETLPLQVEENDDFGAFLGNFLNVAGTGVDGVEVQALPYEQTGAPPIPQRIANDLNTPKDMVLVEGLNDRFLVSKDSAGELIARKLVSTHDVPGMGKVMFDLKEESDGTRRLIDLSTAMWELVHGVTPRVYLIDELDRSLHPHLLEMLIALFLDEDPTPGNSQLIVTTHQSVLMDLSLIRKDELWFIEKDQMGASILFSLADFQPRHDKAILKDYRLGRYGGVPNLGAYQKLVTMSASKCH